MRRCHEHVQAGVVKGQAARARQGIQQVIRLNVSKERETNKQTNKQKE
jgi:hypothetical protein